MFTFLVICAVVFLLVAAASSSDNNTGQSVTITFGQTEPQSSAGAVITALIFLVVGAAALLGMLSG